MQSHKLEVIVVICLVIVSALFGLVSIHWLYLTHFFSKEFISICKIVFSGILGVFISSVLIIKQIRQNTLAKQISNQIELRKMFSDEKRMEINRCIKCSAKEIKNANWGQDHIIKTEAEFKIWQDDYLGIFEIAYFMLLKNQVNKDMFFQSYSYRITNIDKCHFTHEEIYNAKNSLWKYMKKLIEMNNNWKRDNNIVY